MAQPQLRPVGRPQESGVLIRGSGGVRIRKQVHGEREKGNYLLRGGFRPGKNMIPVNKGGKGAEGGMGRAVGLRSTRRGEGAQGKSKGVLPPTTVRGQKNLRGGELKATCYADALWQNGCGVVRDTRRGSGKRVGGGEAGEGERERGRESERERARAGEREEGAQGSGVEDRSLLQAVH